MRDAAAPMDESESRKMKMEILRERLERDAYEIDPHKVADAIVEKLLTARVAKSPARGDQCS
jgi:hypothetical protein